MGSLLSSLLNSAQALSVCARQFATIQNNVANISTPGFARQSQTLIALPFNLDIGFTGGVRAGIVESARSDYAESGVRTQTSLLGQAQQKATDLAQVESLFDLSSATGVPTTLTALFQSFAALAVNPNDPNARQSVLNSAGAVATAFNQTAAGLIKAEHQVDQQVGSNVDAINHLAGQIRDLNATRMQDAASKSDAGLDAQMYSTLQSLASYANFTVLQQPNGTMSVLLGGQTALVIGDHQYSIQADFSAPNTRILDADGKDISSQITSGQVAGLLEEKNSLLPSYLTNLNQQALTLSNSVNAKLQSGVDTSGAAPIVDLFSYNSTAGEAGSISVTDILPDQIAAAYPGAPGGNGNALDLADMANQKLLNGSTLIQAFGNLGGKVGKDISNSKQQTVTQTSMVTQAQSLRDQISAVDLNTEATKLLQIQQAYQANSKILTVLNEMTTTIMGLIR